MCRGCLIMTISYAVRKKKLCLAATLVCIKDRCLLSFKTTILFFTKGIHYTGNLFREST